MRIYEITITLDGEDYKEFFVDAIDFSVALDKAQTYVDTKKRKKDVMGCLMEISSISEELKITPVKNRQGETLSNDY